MVSWTDMQRLCVCLDPSEWPAAFFYSAAMSVNKRALLTEQPAGVNVE